MKQNNNKNNKQKSKKKDSGPRKGEREEEEKREKPRKAQPAAVSARELLSRYHLPVAAKGTLSAVLAKLGFRAVELPGWNDPIHHPLAHYARDLMRLFAMRDLASMFDPDTLSITMWDLYGRPFFYDGPAAAVGVTARIVATRPLQFAGDAARVDVPQDTLVQSHGAMLVDIYQQGNFRAPLSAQMVADAASLTLGSVCYFIAHRMRDPIGGAAYVGVIYGEEGQQREARTLEEVWWPDERDSEMTVFRADPYSAPYPLHPVQLAWLDERVQRVAEGWLHISELSVLGTMHLWKCAFRREAPQEVGPAPAWPSRYRALNVAQWQEKLAHVMRGGPVREYFVDIGRQWLHQPRQQDRFQELYWFRTWGEVVWYDAEASLRLQDVMRFKLLGGRLLQGLARDVETFMGNTLGNLHWMTSNIDLKALVAHNTLLHAILCAGDAGQVQAIDVFRAESADLEAARARIAKASPYERQANTSRLGYKTLLAGGLLAIAGGYLVLRGYGRGAVRAAVTAGAAACLLVWNAGSGEKAYMGWRKDPSPWSSWLWACGEEVLKFCTPLGGVAMAVAEAVSYVRSGVRWQVRVPPFLFHVATIAAYVAMEPSLPLLGVGMCAHVVFNTLAIRRFTFDDWAECWVQGRLPDSQGVAAIPVEVKLRAFEAQKIEAPEHADWRLADLQLTEGSFAYTLDEVDNLYRLDACECCHTGRCADCAITPYLGFSYPLLVAGLMYQPMIGVHTDVAATVSRSFKDPTKGQMESIITEGEFYRKVSKLIRAATETLCRILASGHQPEEMPSIEACALAMGGKRGENLRNTEAAMSVGSYRYSISAMGKYNETIKGQPNPLVNAAGRPTVAVKPRVIRNVSTEYQVDSLPEARVFKEQLTHIFDGSRVWRIGRFNVRFVIAKVGQLNDYARLLSESRELCIVVSCDDCVFASGMYTGTAMFPEAFGENDFSAWDQSQLAPLWTAFELFARSLSLSSGFIASIMETASGAFATRRGMFMMRGQAHMQMSTGVSVTSDLGSLFDILTWVQALISHTDFRTSCESMGIETKMQWHPELAGATFLKGWFVPDGNGSHTWANLPSCILKMGKIFRNPVTLTRERDPHAAALLCQGAICASFPQIEGTYPLVGRYLSKVQDLLRAGGLEDKAKQIALGRYISENATHKSFNLSSNREAVLRLMETRYHTTAQEVEELEALLSVVQRLPCVVSHPLLQRMIDVDYE